MSTGSRCGSIAGWQIVFLAGSEREKRRDTAVSYVARPQPSKWRPETYQTTSARQATEKGGTVGTSTAPPRVAAGVRVGGPWPPVTLEPAGPPLYLSAAFRDSAAGPGKTIPRFQLSELLSGRTGTSEKEPCWAALDGTVCTIYWRKGGGREEERERKNRPTSKNKQKNTKKSRNKTRKKRPPSPWRRLELRKKKKRKNRVREKKSETIKAKKQPRYCSGWAVRWNRVRGSRRQLWPGGGRPGWHWHARQLVTCRAALTPSPPLPCGVHTLHCGRPPTLGNWGVVRSAEEYLCTPSSSLRAVLWRCLLGGACRWDFSLPLEVPWRLARGCLQTRRAALCVYDVLDSALGLLRVCDTPSGLIAGGLRWSTRLLVGLLKVFCIDD